MIIGNREFDTEKNTYIMGHRILFLTVENTTEWNRH